MDLNEVVSQLGGGSTSDITTVDKADMKPSSSVPSRQPRKHHRTVSTKMAHELRKLVDTANTPIFGVDCNGKINEWNFKTAEITGYSREEAFFKPLVSTFIAPRLRDSVQGIFDRALKGEETSNYQLEFETKSKETRYLLVNATTRRNAENAIIGVVGVAQDVTEAIMHDRSVAAAALELRQLVDTANAPIFGIDVNGNVNEWNYKTAEVTGYKREEATNKHLVQEYVVPSLRQAVQEVLDKALEGNETSNYELEFCTKSNEIRHLLVNVTTRRDANLNIIGAVGVAQDVTEAAKHDRAVAAMANELRQLVDTANAPIFGIDVNGSVNEWNDKTAETTGFTKEEAMHKPLVSTFIVPKLRPSVQRVLDNALHGEETSNYELEFCTKSKEIRYLLVNATTRRDVDSNIIGVVGVAQDVTEVGKQDRAMGAMARELRQLIDTANAPIFGIDIQGNVNEWNDKTAEITGFSKDEAIGKPLIKTFIMPKLRQSVHEVMTNALQGNETSNYELEFCSKSDKIRYLLVNATTRRDAENNIVGVVGVAQDVTETKKHDRAVAAMANELRQLVETANAPIFGVDVHGNVNEWNQKTAEITGFSKMEAMGKPLVSTFIVAKSQEEVKEVMANALQGNETSNYKLEFLTKSNEIRYLLVNATTRRDPDYNVIGVVGVAQDVTELSKNDRAVAAMADELRQLIDTANAPIFGIDVNGKVNEWNEKTAEITGFHKNEAFNKPLVSTFIVPSLRQSVHEVLDAALGGTETSNYELEFETKSKEIRYLLVNATTRRDPDNNIVGVVGVAQDVTESTKNDRAMSAMARELRILVDTANAPIFGIDVDGNVNEWNDKTAEITGFSKEEAFDYPLVETFIVPSLRQSVQEVLDNALKGIETSNYQLEFRTKSNEVRYLLVNATTRRDAENNIVGVVGVAQDVTEAVQQDRAVAAIANELRQFVDTANAPIFGIDVKGNVNEWNDKTAEITGFTKDEAFEKPLVTFIVPSLRQSVQDVLDNALQGRETSNYQLEFCTKSNETRYLLVNATTRRDVNNNIVGVVGVAQDVTETAKHDRAVAAMANELRQLIDTANAPIFGIDVDGDVNEWNDKTAEITGFTKEEAFEKPLVSTFIVPSLRQSVQDVLDNALLGRGTSNYELEFRTKTNEIRYLLVNATTRRDTDNNVIGVVGVAQDVTEAAQHDRAVAAMARELRQLVDTANAPIFGIDVHGNVNEWNNKTAEITGFSKEEAFDKPLVSTFIVPKLRESVQNILDNALNGNETSNYELEVRTKSNEIRCLLVNATTRRDANNNTVGVVGVAQDVTEAVKHDRAVAAMANELWQLVDTANAPIFGIDVHGNVNEWNIKTAEVTGFTKDEAFNKPLVSTFIVPSLRPSVQEVLDKALHGDETSNYELEFETKSKEIRYLLVNATTRRDADRNIVGVVGVAQDVTDDRKHSQELREMQYIRASQEAKVETERNMTAYFAHELRNPLHAIDSALNSMPDGLSGVAQSLVDAMQLCTVFMSSIMNNLLDVRKMEEGKMTLNSTPMSLEAILNSVHKMLLPSVRPGVDFITICKTGEKGWVLGDSHRIQQVLTNVVTNAIKYTASGSIALVIEWEDEFVRFECSDTGPGIPLNQQKKLFERFVQRGGAPGTGLGLAIAKHLVDLTKGSICFYSDPSIKPGTSCVVKMPLVVCKQPKVVTKIDSDGAPISEPISFLLIDDVAMNRSMLRHRIKRGIAPKAIISEVSTGEEALVVCGKEKFDIIVVDQYMEEAGGVMVGTDVVFAMRRMRIDSIIIGCSGNDMDDLFMEAGCDWVWGKPMPSNVKALRQLRSALLKMNKIAV